MFSLQQTAEILHAYCHFTLHPLQMTDGQQTTTAP